MQPFSFFINYRRQDTAPIALLLKYEIEKRLQFVRVSVDVDEIKPGDKFPDRIKRLIDEAHATIALIGKHWMPLKEGNSPPREEKDWVVEELKYSNSAPLSLSGENHFELTKRIILPIFVDCPENFDQFILPKSISYISSIQSLHIQHANWPSAIGPLLDNIADVLKLKKRPDKDDYPSPDPAKARTQPIADNELRSILSYDDYDGWYIDNFGSADVRYLVKTFKFQNFNEASDFMSMVSNYCLVLDHHPEWRNVYNSVTASLSTWDARRKVTIFDLNLALYMNMAAKVVCKRSN